MRVLIIGSLAGELGQAARIAIARGAKLDQADSADAALARLRVDARVEDVQRPRCLVQGTVDRAGAVVEAVAMRTRPIHPCSGGRVIEPGRKLRKLRRQPLARRDRFGGREQGGSLG